MTFDEFDSAIARNESALDFGKCTIGEYDDELKRIFEQIRSDVIEEYNKSLKYHWIEEEDLSLSDDFFNYVDRIAEQIKEQK